MKLTKTMESFLDAHRQEAFDLLLELAQIPAPSNHEEKRAEFCKTWLEKQGAEGVYIDEALNVVYPIGDDGKKPLAVFMAHSDVVFPDETPLPLQIKDGKIFCPGVGDDTADVVAILMTAKYLAREKLLPRELGVLLVINAGEEGLGNLKGCRKIMEVYGSRIQEFMTFDAHDCLGVAKAVGSRRFRVEVETEGGHSYTAFGNRNAIACLSELIGRLYQQPIPAKGKSTYNVGLISGGTSVNTIAQHAEMLYEFRSDEMESMEQMQRQFEAELEAFRSQGLEIKVTPVGDRPCTGKVDAQRQQELMERGSQATARYYGREITYQSGSTDCNIPLSQGIPAVCVGCYFGDKSHTREEYVVIDSLLPGLKVAMDLIVYHF